MLRIRGLKALFSLVLMGWFGVGGAWVSRPSPAFSMALGFGLKGLGFRL